MFKDRMDTTFRVLLGLSLCFVVVVACAGAEKNDRDDGSQPPIEEVNLMAGEETSVPSTVKNEEKEPEKKPEKKVSKKEPKSKGKKASQRKTQGKKAAEKKEKSKNKEEKTEITMIKKVVSKYQKSRAVGMKVEKKLHLALMGEDKIGQGKLWYSKGRLKMEIAKPEDSLLVLNDDVIWVVSKMPEEFGGTIQVTKMKSAELKKSNALLAVLFGDEKVWDRFSMISSNKKKNILTVELEPLKGAELADVVKVRVQVDSKRKQITEIAYWDELENITQYKFTKIKFGLKLSKKHFSYKPPSGAEVTEI